VKLKNLYFLRIGDDALESARAYQTKTGAIAAYGRVARELWAYGQSIDATVHIAPRPDDVAECPDFVLSLGPRGGVNVIGA
jgi:hypothetical protein